MKTLILAAVAALGLAACSGPMVNGSSDAPRLPGEPHVMTPMVPYDNTANSLGGRYVGGGDGGGGQ
jgi:ABC-type glycerol-3-phosphate transport system substrate-binding protein